MQQREKFSRLQWIDQYQVSKAVLFWARVGSVAVATIVGFSLGGWTRGGSARAMADKAAAQARQELAAVVCVERFMAAPDARVQLTALQGLTSAYTQGQFVQEGGWTIMPAASGAAPSSTRAPPTTAGRPGCAPRSSPSAFFGQRHADQRRGGRGAIARCALQSKPSGSCLRG